MQVMSGRMIKMASDVMNEEYGITKKDFRGVFWRSFTLLGSMNYERYGGIGLPVRDLSYTEKNLQR